eukprot:gene8128-5663_t
MAEKDLAALQKVAAPSSPSLPASLQWLGVVTCLFGWTLQGSFSEAEGRAASARGPAEVRDSMMMMMMAWARRLCDVSFLHPQGYGSGGPIEERGGEPVRRESSSSPPPSYYLVLQRGSTAADGRPLTLLLRLYLDEAAAPHPPSRPSSSSSSLRASSTTSPSPTCASPCRVAAATVLHPGPSDVAVGQHLSPTELASLLGRRSESDDTVSSSWTEEPLVLEVSVMSLATPAAENEKKAEPPRRDPAGHKRPRHSNKDDGDDDDGEVSLHSKEGAPPPLITPSSPSASASPSVRSSAAPTSAAEALTRTRCRQRQYETPACSGVKDDRAWRLLTLSRLARSEVHHTALRDLRGAIVSLSGRQYARERCLVGGGGGGAADVLYAALQALAELQRDHVQYANAADQFPAPPPRAFATLSGPAQVWRDRQGHTASVSPPPSPDGITGAPVTHRLHVLADVPPRATHVVAPRSPLSSFRWAVVPNPEGDLCYQIDRRLLPKDLKDAMDAESNASPHSSPPAGAATETPKEMGNNQQPSRQAESSTSDRPATARLRDKIKSAAEVDKEAETDVAPTIDDLLAQRGRDLSCIPMPALEWRYASRCSTTLLLPLLFYYFTYCLIIEEEEKKAADRTICLSVMAALLSVDDGHAAVSKHEKVLFNADPALNREEREELLLQRQLDSGTEEQKIIEAQRHKQLQREINRINRTIDVTFADLIGDTPGLRVINPGTEGQHGVGGVGGRAPTGPLVAHSGMASSSVALSSSSSSDVLRRHLPGAPRSSPRRGPPIPGQAMSNYAIAFPVPFNESGFNSVVRWADVCFDETVVAALGPGANTEKIRQVEMPHRVLVTVTCYLLNEVLRRDPNVRDLWGKLRAPILDAVFSPNMLAAEMAKRQMRLYRPPPAKTIGAMLRDEDDNSQTKEGAGGFLDGPLPPPSFQLEAARRRKAAEKEDGVLDPFPIRYANYDNMHDYANYCLWTEELLHAKRMNDHLSQRVDQLKEVVAKSRLVLDLAGRRVDRYRKQAMFMAWKTYTERMRRFRQTATTYITNARKRQLIESSFLKWRRVPLQEKVANLQMEVMELRRKLQMVQETHNVEIATLKAQTRETQDQLQDMTLKDEALRNQMLESHRIETTGLRTALTRAALSVTQLRKHSRRWERLAKTLRPPVLCRSVPKPMMMLALELKHVEEDALSSVNLPAIHSQVTRASLTLLEQLLLKWVNFIMMGSPMRKSWTQVMSFARHVSVPQGASGGGGPMAHLLGPLPEGSDPALFGPSGLLMLVRELRRLQIPEAPDLAALLQVATAAGNNNQSGTAGQGSSPTEISCGSLGSSMSATMSVASPSPIALYQELTELLHYYTSEGFCPSLLQQCPFLDVFYNPASLSHLTNTICMTWVLAALFTGYVHKMIVVEAMMGFTPKTPYLRLRSERGLRHKPNPALSGVVPGEFINVQAHTWDEVATAMTAGGSYIVSANTTVGKPTTGGGSSALWGAAGMERASSPGTGSSATPPVVTPLSKTVTFRVTDYREIEFVRDNTDTASDMEIYLGGKEEDLPDSEDEYDVDEIMAGMVKEEEREHRRRRRERLENHNHNHNSSGSVSGGEGSAQVALAGASVSQQSSFYAPDDVDEDGEGGGGDPDTTDGASAWHPASSLGMNDDEDEDEEDMEGSGKKPFYWEKDDETYAGIREIQRTTLDLEAQVIKERKRHAAQAAAFLMPAKEDLLTVEQIQFLHSIPHPSKAFDITLQRPKFKGAKRSGKGGSRPFGRRPSMRSMASESSRRNTGPQLLGGGARKGSSPALPSISGAISPGLDDDDPRILRRKIRRVSVLTFMKRLVNDNAHRQQWIGVARIVVSLLCRVRVLDSGHGVPNRKWGEGRSENATPYTPSKRGGTLNTTGGSSNLSGSRKSKAGESRKSRVARDEDDSFLYDTDAAHKNVGKPKRRTKSPAHHGSAASKTGNRPSMSGVLEGEDLLSTSLEGSTKTSTRKSSHRNESEDAQSTTSSRTARHGKGKHGKTGKPGSTPPPPAPPPGVSALNAASVTTPTGPTTTTAATAAQVSSQKKRSSGFIPSVVLGTLDSAEDTEREWGASGVGRSSTATRPGRAGSSERGAGPQPSADSSSLPPLRGNQSSTGGSEGGSLVGRPTTTQTLPASPVGPESPPPPHPEASTAISPNSGRTVNAAYALSSDIDTRLIGRGDGGGAGEGMNKEDRPRGVPGSMVVMPVLQPLPGPAVMGLQGPSSGRIHGAVSGALRQPHALGALTVGGTVPQPPRTGSPGAPTSGRARTFSQGSPSLGTGTVGTASFPAPCDSSPSTSHTVLDVTSRLDPADRQRFVSGGIPVPPTAGDSGIANSSDMTYTMPQHMLDQLTMRHNIAYVSPSSQKPVDRFDLKANKNILGGVRRAVSLLLFSDFPARIRETGAKNPRAKEEREREREKAIEYFNSKDKPEQQQQQVQGGGGRFPYVCFEFPVTQQNLYVLFFFFPFFVSLIIYLFIYFCCCYGSREGKALSGNGNSIFSGLLRFFFCTHTEREDIAVTVVPRCSFADVVIPFLFSSADWKQQEMVGQPSPEHRRTLEEWSSVVDSISAERSAAPLPAVAYKEEDYLPPALTEELLTRLLQREKDVHPTPEGTNAGEAETSTPFDTAAARLFRTQMTMMESLHPQPLVPHFRSRAVDVRARRRGEHSSAVAVDPVTGAGSEGPNFYQTYLVGLQAEQQGDSGTAAGSSSVSRPVSPAAEGRRSGAFHAPLPALPPMRADSSTRLTAGFVNPKYYAAVHRQPDFMPIILVPPAVTAPVQLLNVKQFLEQGSYVDPTNYFIDQESGAASVQQAKPPFQIVSSSRFRLGISAHVAFVNFRVVDDPQQVDNWDHVCAAVVTGQQWQLEKWFPDQDRSITQPSLVFRRIAGFLPYFEEDKIPPAIHEWRVTPLMLTKRVVKAQQHIREAARFWEKVYKFLDTHPLFNRFTGGCDNVGGVESILMFVSSPFLPITTDNRYKEERMNGKEKKRNFKEVGAPYLSSILFLQEGSDTWRWRWLLLLSPPHGEHSTITTTTKMMIRPPISPLSPPPLYGMKYKGTCVWHNERIALRLAPRRRMHSTQGMG